MLDIPFIQFDVRTDFLTLRHILYVMTYLLILWHSFWRYGVILDVSFDHMTYILKLLYIFWYYDVHSILFQVIDILLDIIMRFLRYDLLLDVMTQCLNVWHTFWYHDVLFDIMMYFMTRWCTLHTFILYVAHLIVISGSYKCSAKNWFMF